MFLLINNNLPFLWIFYTSSFVGIVSTTNWFILWILIEINTLSFMPILLSENTNNNGEAGLLYLITQGIGSIFLLMALLSEESLINSYVEPNSLVLAAALLNLGGSIFFNWIYLISFGIIITTLYLILSIQNLAPFFLLMFSQDNLSALFAFFVVSSSILASWINLNQNNFNTIITISSLSNLSWLMIATTISNIIWLFYFTVYTLSVLYLFFTNLTFLIADQNNSEIMDNTLVFLSLGGLPPLPGFLPNLIILQYSMYNNLWVISVFLLLLACVDIYIYLRFSYTVSININSSFIWQIMNNHITRYVLLSIMGMSSLALFLSLYTS